MPVWVDTLAFWIALLIMIVGLVLLIIPIFPEITDSEVDQVGLGEDRLD